MNLRTMFAPLRTAPAAFVAIGAAATFAFVIAGAHAQTPPAPTAPAAPKAAPPKAAPKAAPKTAPAPQAAPAPAAPDTSAQAQQVPLVYTPWIKICGTNPQEQNAKQLCQTAKEARLVSGQFMAAAALIERADDTKKVLQVMLPPGLLLQPGTRVIIDKNPPMSGPFVICFVNACMAHYEVAADFLGKLKTGQTLEIQAMNPNQQAVNFLLPLADFAKANEGPPTDPKVLEEQNKKLQDELQRRADEARKKLQDTPQPTK